MKVCLSTPPPHHSSSIGTPGTLSLSSHISDWHSLIYIHFFCWLFSRNSAFSSFHRESDISSLFSLELRNEQIKKTSNSKILFLLPFSVFRCCNAGFFALIQRKFHKVELSTLPKIFTLRFVKMSIRTGAALYPLCWDDHL